MELISIYDEKRLKTKKVVERHWHKEENEYDLSVQIWILNDNNEIILTKRAGKMTYPYFWECTEGIVDYNETSLEAAIREVKEELGIEIYANEIVKLKIDREKENPKYTDVYLCRKNISLEQINLQKEECIDVKIVNEDEYNSMCKNNEVIPYLNYFYEMYRKNEEYGVIDLQNHIIYEYTGPTIFDYRIEGRVLKVKTSPVKNIIFYTNMRKCKNIFGKNNDDITNGEYTLQGDEFYVCLKIIDKNGKSAWGQPFYIDINPYFD